MSVSIGWTEGRRGWVPPLTELVIEYTLSFRECEWNLDTKQLGKHLRSSDGLLLFNSTMEGEGRMAVKYHRVHESRKWHLQCQQCRNVWTLELQRIDSWHDYPEVQPCPKCGSTSTIKVTHGSCVVSRRLYRINPSQIV